MHYTIAHLIAETLEIKNRKKFILGNLEPDLSSREDGSYMRAHFGGENDKNGTKGINWTRFAKQYQNSILSDDEVLGYFVHLITDACWLKNIRDKYIRKYSTEQKKELTAKGYEDMYNYNGLFIHKYQLENMIHKIDKLEISEANIKYKDSLINGLISDFAQPQIPFEEFEVYPYEDVMAFIHFSVEKGITEINALRMNKSLGDPEEFYVKQ